MDTIPHLEEVPLGSNDDPLRIARHDLTVCVSWVEVTVCLCKSAEMSVEDTGKARSKEPGVWYAAAISCKPTSLWMDSALAMAYALWYWQERGPSLDAYCSPSRDPSFAPGESAPSCSDAIGTVNVDGGLASEAKCALGNGDALANAFPWLRSAWYDSDDGPLVPDKGTVGNGYAFDYVGPTLVGGATPY